MTRLTLSSRTMLSALSIVATASMTAGAFAQCNSSVKSARSSSCSAGKPVAMVNLGSYGKSDIVDTAVGAGSFETLVAAVQAAGLVDALKGDGPFTVFAPTDDAFAKLPHGTIQKLLRPENRGTLTAILTFHVVPGDLAAADVVRLNGAKTLNGQRVDFITSNGGVTVDGAKVVKADITCSNGRIHVIDSVIMPKAAGLAGLLKSDGPFTVLAPTDEAFAALGSHTIESLLRPENKQALAEILKYHVIPGRVYAADAVAAGSGKTAQGEWVRFDIRGGQLFVDGARIVATDIDTSNGVIHVIDAVIMPPSN